VNHPVSTSALTSTVPEQSISAFCHVEIMHDLDDGRATLCIATESNLGDFREASPARALGVIEDIEALIAKAKRLIREYEARDTLAAILAEHDLQIEEWDTATLDPKLRGQLMAVHDPTLGNGRTIVVPTGQDPIERLNAVARAVSNMEQA
jgi:hypothetical protein